LLYDIRKYVGYFSSDDDKYYRRFYRVFVHLFYRASDLMKKMAA